MAVQYCSSFSLETLQGVHDFTSDVIKLAIYDENASFDSDTTVYTASNEISPAGYNAGGAALTLLATYPKLEDGWGSLRFDEVSWTLTEAATVRRGLIYNSSKANRAILAITFPLTTTNRGDFIVRFPLTLAPQVQHRFSLG